MSHAHYFTLSHTHRTLDVRTQFKQYRKQLMRYDKLLCVILYMDISGQKSGKATLYLYARYVTLRRTLDNVEKLCFITYQRISVTSVIIIVHQCHRMPQQMCSNLDLIIAIFTITIINNTRYY